METHISLEQIDQAAQFIRNKMTCQPETGIILGSGLGDLAEKVEQAQKIPFADIPSWPVSTVAGHMGRLVIGYLENKPVLIMQGRIHYYEGYSMSQVTFPIRVMKRLGIKNLVITNAAGGINQSFNAGDIMLINDHIAMGAMNGLNPLLGPNMDEFGPRFPDMSQVYDRQYQAAARQVAQEQSLILREGVYIYLSGPSFETPADLRFLKLIGADAVGMSTVPEAIVARHCGLRILGFSCITNKSSLDGNAATTHQEVMDTSKILAPKLMAMILGVLRHL